MSPTSLWALDGLLLDALAALEVEFERVDAGAYVVTLHGEHRPSTLVWLIVGEQAVAVEAFVLHLVADGCADPAPVHRWLLRRNLELRGVHFSLDDVGDVFLVGSLPHAGLDAAGLDGLLGEVLALLERATGPLLTLAYGDRLATDAALSAKVRADGAGRRPAGTPLSAPRRDARR